MRIFLAVLAVLVILVGAAVAWLAAGRWLTLALDHVVTLPVAALPTEPLVYEGERIRIGDASMTLTGLRSTPFPLQIAVDAENRAVLTTAGRSIVLGLRTSVPDTRGVPDFDFAAGAGDTLALSVARSLVPWPTPLQINVMGGASPSWKRYLYYRLVWRKPDGARLEMRWRYEQSYLSTTGWTEGYMLYDAMTGLLSATISEK
jgi:hypothetical protein